MADDKKPMTEREAMQKVSALAARLRETKNKKSEENPAACIWEGRPAFWTPGEAWALIEGSWEPVNSSNVGMSARLVPAAVLAEVFPDTPPLPAGAFSTRGAA